MGLDMYLTKRVNVKNYDFLEEKYQVEVLQDGKPMLGVAPEKIIGVAPEKIIGVEMEVTYWRKFNALHSWFVNNCANGVDDCRPIFIPDDKIVELVEILKEVKETLDNSKLVDKKVMGYNNQEFDVQVYDCEEKIEELFPPQSGFFFGSTQIDEYYKQEVERTIELLERELKENEENNLTCDYYYEASW